MVEVGMCRRVICILAIESSANHLQRSSFSDVDDDGGFGGESIPECALLDFDVIFSASFARFSNSLFTRSRTAPAC